MYIGFLVAHVDNAGADLDRCVRRPIRQQGERRAQLAPSGEPERTRRRSRSLGRFGQFDRLQSAFGAVRVWELGDGCQCPNERNPTRFTP